MLQDEYGVDWRSIKWIQGAINAAGAHSVSTGIPKLLKPADIVQADPGKSLTDLLILGEIDAAMGAQSPDCGPHPSIGRLFPEFRAVERDYHIRTKLFPIMHLVGIKKELAERYPWLPGSLYKAFVKAKQIALDEVRQIAALNVTLPWVEAEALETRALMGEDYWRYGIDECAHEIEALARYSYDQGMSERKLTAQDLFAPSTFEISKI